MDQLCLEVSSLGGVGVGVGVGVVGVGIGIGIGVGVVGVFVGGNINFRKSHAKAKPLDTYFVHSDRS